MSVALITSRFTACESSFKKMSSVPFDALLSLKLHLLMLSLSFMPAIAPPLSIAALFVKLHEMMVMVSLLAIAPPSFGVYALMNVIFIKVMSLPVMLNILACPFPLILCPFRQL